MPNAEFSECEFEANLLDELRHYRGSNFCPFKPSRILEQYLGYDLAIKTSFPLLKAYGIYADNSLVVPTHAPNWPFEIPHRLVSAFVQCKRPFKVTRSNKQTSSYFKHWKRPYFRFSIKTDQNSNLCKIEKNTKGKAVVRYASPCFHTHVQMQKNAIGRTVAKKTKYEAPSKLVNHQIYTYVSIKEPGKAFSDDPEEFPTSNFILADLLEVLRKSDRTLLAEHVFGIWQTVVATGKERGAEELKQDEEIARLAFDGLETDPIILSRDFPRTKDAHYPLQDERPPSLLSLAIAIIGINRIARELGASWTVYQLS